MGMALKSQVVFRERRSGTEIEALRHVRIEAASTSPEWQGLRLEVGSSRGWDVDDLMVDGHVIGINLADVPLHLETRSDSAWFSVCMPPMTIWINPEGRPFSIRHGMTSYWASVVVDGKFLDSVVGRHYELKAGHGLRDDVLTHLIRSLIANLQDQQAASSIITEAMVKTFVHALAIRHGTPAPELLLRGGIASHHLKALLAWLDERLEDPLTIDIIAAQAGLSAAHFSREFKRSMGLTPWGYIVERRLDRARNLLRAGEAASLTASHCGFSDQSHLSRLFKQRFGMSPAAFARSARTA